jgi:energy-coupling factor transporter transmembrane protein EcfT
MVIAARLFVISASTIGFTAAVPLMELAGGLRTLGMPVSIAAVFISSFNIYFLTKQKTRQIIDAQRSRGLRPKGLILGRARMYIPILRPLLFGMLLAAVERSSLWQSRGYLSFIGHQSLGIRQRDCIAMFMALMVVLAAVLSRWIV